MPRVLSVWRLRAALPWITLTGVGAIIAPLAAQSAPNLVPTSETQPAFGLSATAAVGMIIAACRTECEVMISPVPLVAVGALAGAAVGTAVGLIVDSIRFADP